MEKKQIQENFSQNQPFSPHVLEAKGKKKKSQQIRGLGFFHQVSHSNGKVLDLLSKELLAISEAQRQMVFVARGDSALKWTNDVKLQGQKPTAHSS